jgi:uncharacterized sulfatase
MNLTPDELYIEKHLMGLKGNAVLNNPYWATWVRDSWENPEIYRLVKRYQSRPEISFYNTVEDPYEMNDLAQNKNYEQKIEGMRKELQRWMEAEGDPGVMIDTKKAHQAAKNGKHLF